MYEYSDTNYNSVVNHFENDDYHEDDVESKFVGKDIVTRLKNLKRRYRDVGEYCDAMELIDRYMDSLEDAYGGKKRFRLMLQLGLVTEYIPVVPILRKTKNSKWFFKKGALRSYDDFDENQALPFVESSIGDPDKIEFDYKLVNKNGVSRGSTIIKNQTRRYVTSTLDAIEQYYGSRVGRPTKKNKKKLKKKILRRRKKDIRIGDEVISVEQRIDDYYYYKDFRIDPNENPDELVNYKGTTFRVSQAEEYKVFDELRELGINLGVKQLSRKTRKIVRRKDKRKKKAVRKKKKAEKLQKAYMEKFTGKYDTFNNFKKELGTMLGRDAR